MNFDVFSGLMVPSALRQDPKCRSEIPEYLRIIAKPVVDAILAGKPLSDEDLLKRILAERDSCGRKKLGTMLKVFEYGSLNEEWCSLFLKEASVCFLKIAKVGTYGQSFH